MRIIVYRNGMSTEPVEVVADLNKYDEASVEIYYLSMVLMDLKFDK